MAGVRPSAVRALTCALGLYLLAPACVSEYERGDLAGRPCPCLPGWVCDESQGAPGVCVPSVTGAAGSLGLTSGPPDGGAGRGDAGAGSDAGAGQCTVAPATGLDCPAPCSDCSGGVCHIRCDAASPCKGTLQSPFTVDCPAGFHCEVSCVSDDTCHAAVVRCSGGQSCDVLCTGKKSCEELSLVCADGPCSLYCVAGSQVCRDSDMACGRGTCQAMCEGNGKPTVTGCEASCSTACGC